MSKMTCASEGMKGAFLSLSLHLELIVFTTQLEELRGARCLYANCSLKTAIEPSASFIVFYEVVCNE